ncbi:MAG TPA: hypothetical protein VFS92_11315, partial [Planctomycetota bacterium]|nr:hypothetical protein [Planctomycetota bacterium]
VEVPLLPGGHLVVVSDSFPPPRGGGLEIRRVDRHPIPLCEVDNGVPRAAEAYGRVRVMPGTLLGPFPEGTHRFEVLLGGIRIGEASAGVTAGRIGVLRIPTR